MNVHDRVHHRHRSAQSPISPPPLSDRIPQPSFGPRHIEHPRRRRDRAPLATASQERSRFHHRFHYRTPPRTQSSYCPPNSSRNCSNERQTAQSPHPRRRRTLEARIAVTRPVGITTGGRRPPRTVHRRRRRRRRRGGGGRRERRGRRTTSFATASNPSCGWTTRSRGTRRRPSSNRSIDERMT